jgi:hypothetical protein
MKWTLTAMLTTAVALATAAPALAADATVANPEGPRAKAADGYFYIYNEPDFNGSSCGFTGNWDDYTDAGDCGDVNDRTTSLWNNGYPGGFDDVFVYAGIEYGYPYGCLGNGDSWQNLSLGIERFSDGTTMDNRISSHAWAPTCG